MKKLKKYLLRSLIALCLMITILLIANATCIAIRGRLAEQRLKAIRAAGDPVSFTQLVPTAVPPEMNAATFLRRAQPGVENISKELYAIYSDQSFNDGLPSKSQLQTIESALKGAPDVIPLLQQAADSPEYDPQVDYAVDPQVFIANGLDRLSPLRAVIRVLNARVLLLIAKEDRTAALDTCLSMLRLSRLFEREPATIGFLVSLACRTTGIRAANAVLRSGALPNASHQALDTELALHDSSDGFIRALKTERVLGIESFQSFRSSLGMFQAGFLSDECDYLDLITEQLEFAERPFSDLVAANIEGKSKGRIGPLSRLAISALLQCRKASDRTRAQVRCLRVLNAILNRTKPDDTSDPQLAELGLPEAATNDPFTGTPLHLKKTTTGWLVYSTGENLKDDGGELSDSKDAGVGPITPKKSTDIK